MAEKRVSEVARAWRELYEKGVQAVQRQNLDYAIELFTQALLKEPAFYECREALRGAQLKKAGAAGGFFKKVLGTASSSPMVAKAQLSLRNSPIEALHTAEQILNSDPRNESAHKVLAEAALAVDLPRTAVLSLDFVYKNDPRDRTIALRLAEALAAAGQIPRAESILVELQRSAPNDAGVTDALKNLSARRTMDEGGYENIADGKGSYRDILKDKQEAVALEQANRQVKTDVTAELIAEYEKRLRTESSNLTLLRQVAELYAQKKEFGRALEYYEKISSSHAGADPSLEKAISDLRIKKLDWDLEHLEPNALDYAEQKSRLEAERQNFLLSDAQRRIEKYPTDLALRFELGELYFRAGRISEAIQEFQKAQSNPNKRVQAMSYLGQCFVKRGINDLAARTFQNAIKEKPVIDEEKKDLIYQLGLVLEKMGKGEDAIEQLKQIYEIDIGYKDVAARVDAFYAGK